MSDELHPSRRLLAQLVVIDGYPPADIEGLWCTPDGVGHFVVDSIPFFVDGYALGDVVLVDNPMDDGDLVLNRLELSGGHSSVRALFFGEYDINEVQNLRNLIVELGCESEFDLQRGIIAIDVPPQVEFARVASVLNALENGGTLEWWVGALRHQ